ncbi:exodeoxyribonuclease III [Inediibacterium massiliense]|uniref:exodeoxyribonuclease III n=1 Tax=Inediibacterium massiliense TaxID=1658111 RepID=UPI0006B45AAA|nr:exodeoxyribonuclease III [Inediibacterium massiliense]
MKIYSWNVNGIRAVQKKGFVEWVQSEEPDILCIQETKANVEQLEDTLIHIKGYYSYFHSAKRKGYSGVAVYTKEKPKFVHEKIGIDKFDEEGRILILEYECFTLLNIYFPNGQKDDERLSYKLEFYDFILEYCEKLKKQGKKLVICGDYNTAHKDIDLKNPKANEDRSGFLPIERAWIDKFISYGYIDTFRYIYPETIKYSWWSYRFNARKNNAGWRIDYHFVSDNLINKVKDAQILNEVEGSDHCPVTIDLDL